MVKEKMLKEDHNKERDKIINNHNKEHTIIDQYKIKDLNKSLLRKFKMLKKKHNNNNQPSSTRRKRSKLKRNSHQWRNKNIRKKFNQQQQQKLNTNKNKNNQLINNQNKLNINKSHKPNNTMYQSMRRKSINHHIMSLRSNKHIRSNSMLSNHNHNIMWNLPIMSKRRHMRIIMKSNIQLRKRLLVIIMKSNQLLNHPNRNRLTVFQLYKTLIHLLLGKISNKHAIKTHSFSSLFNLKLTHKEFPMSELPMVAWKMFKSGLQEQALKDHKKHFDHIFIKNL